MAFHARALSTVLFSLILAYSAHISCADIANNNEARIFRPKQHSRFSYLARYVIDRGDITQREFAIITLSTMIDSYSQVLHDSSQIKSRTLAENRKRATWGWATSSVISSLNHQLQKLEGGAPFNVFLDHIGQLLIIIDGTTILANSPYVHGQPDFERKIINYFCLTNDCSWLKPEEDESEVQQEPEAIVDWRRRLSKGAWIYSQHNSPAYEIGDLIHCEYADSFNRDKKAEYCHQIAKDILQIVILLTELNNTDTHVNWDTLVNSQPHSSNDTIDLIPGNNLFTVKPIALPALHASDWRRLIEWFANDGPSNEIALKIKQPDTR
jgi:hypothetical protein